jgi:prophage regulatory protein
MDLNHANGSIDQVPLNPRSKALKQTERTVECELINANQLAELLNISERTLYRLKSIGQLPVPIVLGASVRWRLSAIRQWIEMGCPQKPNTK